MDRLVSAYRNKLECRAGKEYYYKVNKYYHKKKNIAIRKTTLNWLSKNAQRMAFYALLLLIQRKVLQEHGKKAVQSYRKVGKLKFGEERWRQKFRNCVSETFHDKSKVQRDAKLASRLSHRGTWFIWSVEKHYPVEVEPSFWEFVQYVLAHPTGDPHWKPFTQVCGNDQGELTSSFQMIYACLVFLSSKNFTSLIYKLDSFGFYINIGGSPYNVFSCL